MQEVGVEIRVESRSWYEAVAGQVEMAAASHQAAADVVAKSVHLDSGQTRSLAPVVIQAALALGVKAFIDCALDRLFKALFVADEIDDRAALVGRQGLPFLFANAFSALAAGIADHDADGLYQLALPVGVGIELFETDAKGALVAVGGLGAGDSFKGDFVGVFLHRLLVGRGEDAELEEGIA